MSFFALLRSRRPTFHENDEPTLLCSNKGGVKMSVTKQHLKHKEHCIQREVQYGAGIDDIDADILTVKSSRPVGES